MLPLSRLTVGALKTCSAAAVHTASRFSYIALQVLATSKELDQFRGRHLISPGKTTWTFLQAINTIEIV